MDKQITNIDVYRQPHVAQGSSTKMNLNIFKLNDLINYFSVLIFKQYLNDQIQNSKQRSSQTGTFIILIKNQVDVLRLL